MWRLCVCCLLSYKQSCDVCVVSYASSSHVMCVLSLSYKQSCDVCVVCFSLSAVNWVTRTRRWRCCRPLSCFFSGSSTLRSHPSMPTTLTCCHGDEDIYFALSFIQAYHPDMLSWWSGRLLRPHFHQGLPLWHIAMVMRAFTLPSHSPRPS